MRFPYNPDSLKLFNGYTKLLAVFMYFLVGYNLARMERGYEILKWFSVSSVLIGIFAFSPPLLGRRIDFLYYGSNRFRGLMNDPNYFSVLQSCAIAYVLGTQRHVLKKYVALFILAGSILMSGSKTGVVTLGVYLCLKLIEPLTKQKISSRTVMVWLVVASAVVGASPVLFGKWDDIIDYMVNLIP